MKHLRRTPVHFLNRNPVKFQNVKRFHRTLIISQFILKIYLIKLIEVLVQLIDIYILYWHFTKFLQDFLLLATLIKKPLPPPGVPEEVVITFFRNEYTKSVCLMIFCFSRIRRIVFAFHPILFGMHLQISVFPSILEQLFLDLQYLC